MRIIGLLKKHGLLGLVIKYIEKKTDVISKEYAGSYSRYLPTEEELARQRFQVSRRLQESQSQPITPEGLVYRPIISIVVPTYRTPERFLCSLIESVQAQTYDNWELCLVDATEEKEFQAVYDVVQAYQKEDGRIRYQKLNQNAGISENTNQGFGLARGEYIALLDHDDLLTPNALYEVVRALNEQRDGMRYGLIYSDEDKTDETGEHFFEPHFKPDYNEEMLNHYNYICHFLVFRKSLLEQVGGLRKEYDGAQDYDFVLRCTEQLKKDEIYHIPKVLYHWRVHAASTAAFSGSKDYAYEAGKRAVQQHLLRVKEKGIVLGTKGREYVGIDRTTAFDKDTLRAEYLLEENRCGQELREEKQHENKQHENKQVEDSLYMEKYKVLLSPGYRAKDKDFQKRLAAYFEKNSKDGPIGMVGGKIVTSSPGIFKKIVSCGYSFDKKGRVFPLFEGMYAWMKGYFRRAVVPQDMSGASLDFCLIDKAAYDRVGGVDEALPQPYRDMDFSLRLQKAGYRVILSADVVAVRTKRGQEQPVHIADAKEKKAQQILFERYEDVITKGDRYYNENFSGNGYL